MLSYTCCMCQVRWRRPRPGDSARFARQKMKASCDGWPAQAACPPGRSDCLPDRSDCLSSPSDCLPSQASPTACQAVWLPARWTRWIWLRARPAWLPPPAWLPGRSDCQAGLPARQVWLPARPAWLPSCPAGWTVCRDDLTIQDILIVYGLSGRSSAIGCLGNNIYFH